jgi:hypothetical protein
MQFDPIKPLQEVLSTRGRVNIFLQLCGLHGEPSEFSVFDEILKIICQMLRPDPFSFPFSFLNDEDFA